MNLSRRQFSQWIGAVVAATACFRSSLGAADSGLNLGLNTWSLRALSQEEALPVIIQGDETGRTAGLSNYIQPCRACEIKPGISSWRFQRAQVTSNTAATGGPEED